MAGPSTRPQTAMDLPCYKEHKVVADNRMQRIPPPVPVGIYLDGVRYTSIVSGRPDSILGIWLINLLTSKRHLLGVLLGSDKCEC
eukprot:796690-Pyramimonas_sp.AAC.1